MICEICQQAKIDVEAYRTGYGDKYSPEALEDLHNLRNQLCEAKKNCQCPDCPAQNLIDKLDTDPNIQKKKGTII